MITTRALDKVMLKFQRPYRIRVIRALNMVMIIVPIRFDLNYIRVLPGFHISFMLAFRKPLPSPVFDPEALISGIFVGRK